MIKVEITQTKITFWRRWFTRYYLQIERDDNGVLIDSRIIVETGLLSRGEDDAPLAYYNEAVFFSSIKERLLGYGDITLYGTKDATKQQLTLHNIVNVKEVQNLLNRLIREHKGNVTRVEFLS